MLKKYFSVVAIVLMMGCGSIQFTKTTSLSITPRPNECDFDILTENPTKKYETIGVVDIKPSNFGGGWVRDLGTFKNKVRPLVCANGGDAVIVKVNGFNIYQNGTVIKYVK